MAVALKARNDLYTVLKGVIVDFPKLLYGISAAHVTEIRSALKLDHVLGVEHHHIVAHKSKIIQQFFHGCDGGDGAPGRVYHGRKSSKEAILDNLEFSLSRLLAEYAEPTEELHRVTVINHSPTVR